MNQVFTYPYTPEENGHIESFHKTLSQAIRGHSFETLRQLDSRLAIFYDNYNNHRTHGSICGLTPYLFEQLWYQGKIQRTVIDEVKRKVKLKLLTPKYQLPGNESLREASCSNSVALDGERNLQKLKTDGATVIQPRAQRSPSVASR